MRPSNRDVRFGAFSNFRAVLNDAPFTLTNRLHGSRRKGPLRARWFLFTFVWFALRQHPRVFAPAFAEAGSALARRF